MIRRGRGLLKPKGSIAQKLHHVANQAVPIIDCNYDIVMENPGAHYIMPGSLNVTPLVRFDTCTSCLFLFSLDLTLHLCFVSSMMVVLT